MKNRILLNINKYSCNTNFLFTLYFSLQNWFLAVKLLFLGIIWTPYGQRKKKFGCRPFMSTTDSGTSPRSPATGQRPSSHWTAARDGGTTTHSSLSATRIWRWTSRRASTPAERRSIPVLGRLRFIQISLKVSSNFIILYLQLKPLVISIPDKILQLELLCREIADFACTMSDIWHT